MKFEFIESKIKEVKEEIKARKKWKTALINEYGKVRTFKYNQQNEIIKMVDMANIMIEQNEKILEEYKIMLEKVKKVENR